MSILLERLYKLVESREVFASRVGESKVTTPSYQRLVQSLDKDIIKMALEVDAYYLTQVGERFHE